MNSGALRAILADAPRSENFGCGGVENSVLPRSFLDCSRRAPYSEKNRHAPGAPLRTPRGTPAESGALKVSVT